MPSAPTPPDPAKLGDAIKSRKMSRFAPYLTSGIDLSAPLPAKRPVTPLDLAIEYGATDIAVALIRAGVALSKKNLNLVWAVTTQRPDIVRLFLEKGADVNAKAVMGSPLRVAARHGMTDIVRMLLDAGADVNVRSITSYPLKDAVENNHTESAVLLLEAGATVEPDDRLLVHAVEKRNVRIAQALIEAGVDVNERADVTDEAGSNWKIEQEVLSETGIATHFHHERKLAFANATPLVVAAGMGQRRLVQSLVDAGADLYLADADGATALDWARRAGHDEIAALLTEAMASRPRTVALETDLLFAVEQGELARVGELLAAGADPNARDDRPRSNGYTPLMLAAAAGHVDVAAALLDAGADLGQKDDTVQDSDQGFNYIYGEGGSELAREAGCQLHRTALALAAEKGHAEVVRLLLARGADANVLDRTKATPLQLAAAAGAVEAVRELLRAGADVNARDRSKAAAIHLAARAGHEAVVDELIAAGAKLKLKNGDGDTPLHLAAGGAYPVIVAELLLAGADANADHGGNTPLHAALGTQHLIRDVEGGEVVTRFKIPPGRIATVVRLLLEAGADPRAANKHGETPLRRASQLVELTGSLQELVELLEIAPEFARPAAKRTRRVKKPAAAPEREARRERRPAAAELPCPDFRPAAASAAYEAALAELERLCGSQRQPLGDVSGGYSLHVHSSKSLDLAQLHKDFLKRGCYVFATDSIQPDRVAVLPTTNRDDVIAAMQTNGANYDLSPADIAAWLRELEAEHPFVLTGIGFDFLSGEFTRKVSRPAQLARQMYQFCPDIVDQGVGDLKALAAQLRASKKLFFWWD